MLPIIDVDQTLAPWLEYESFLTLACWFFWVASISPVILQIHGDLAFLLSLSGLQLVEKIQHEDGEEYPNPGPLGVQRWRFRLNVCMRGH
jgi:hypothetical protein